MSTAGMLQAVAGRLGPDHTLSGLPSGALAWALARVAEATCAGGSGARPLLVCAGSRDEADRLVMELRFHLGPKGPAVLRLPADDSRPWDGVSPHPDIPRERLRALYALGEGEGVVVVAPGRALLQRALPRATLRGLRLKIERGDIIERDALINKLIERGYLMVQRVEEPGCVSRQGSVIDLWPTGAPHLLRIELFDDELESIHALDPESRKSLGPLKQAVVLPAREAVVGPEALRRASAETLAVVEGGSGSHLVRQRVLGDLQRGLWFPAAEDYLCALYPVVSPLSVAAEGGALVVIAEPAELAVELERADRVAQERWRALDPLERPVVSPAARFASPEQVDAELRALRCARLGGMVAEGAAPSTLFDARENSELRVGKGELAPVIGTLQRWLESGWQVAVVVDSQSGLERLRAMFQPHGLRLHPRAIGEHAGEGLLTAWVGALDRGFHAPESQLAIVAADEIFGAKARPVTRGNKGRGQTLGTSGLSQLRVGDLVVHVRHGIGKFIGLKRLSVPIGGEEIEQDMVELEYRGGDRMYLPVTRLDRLQPYRSTGGAPPALDKLGGQTWDRRKSKARDRIAGMANEILRIHALREVIKGEAYEGLPEAYLRFEQSFAWNETADQEAAIADVLSDLAAERPMDRLIIGDVGFGKTEVALRAAMRVVLAGKQAALLCPTTVLAYQHYKTACERFEPFGIKVALHSSFRSGQSLRETLKGLESGEVQLLVGTTGILGRSVRWNDLALVIVDEEHRFGVKQKEKLKKLARARDGRPAEYLAMSATPIPRTLHMAISGLRDLSVIRTPPEGRRPVQTRVLKWNEATIRSEILHELRRGGQVFFVHNRIESIEVLHRRLADLVPEARFLVAHGQLDPESLERTLVQFVQGEANVLLCTTIVESGIDMPNVNTILVNRADQLGLAQLYQLRGRVGRGTVRGYCSLIVPEDDAALQKDAMERLRVLQDNQELGSGLMIAEADLELRGSGDLLGESQHGAIHELGLDTYIDMLDAAVAHARGDLARERLDPEVEVPVRALLPESYIEDLDQRLGEYRRLSATRSVPELRALLTSWEDDYGAPPEEALNLGWLTETRLRCRALGIERVAWLKVRLLVDLHQTTTVTEATLNQLVRRDPQRFRRSDAAQRGVTDAEPGRRLEVRFSAEEGAHPFRLLHWVLASLERPPEDNAPAVIIDHDQGIERRLRGREPQDGPVRRIVRRPR